MIRITFVEKLNKTKKLIQKLRNPTRASKEYADVCTRKFFNRMVAGRDPYGKPHKPLTAKYKKWKLQRTKAEILILSGKTMNAYKAEYSALGVREVIYSKIALYHQKGTKKLPVRLYLPTVAKGLPKENGIALFSILKRFFEE